MSWIDLSSDIAVVTGGGAGIGRGIALGLAAVGAQVVVLDRNKDAEKVVTEIREAGGRSFSYLCDVTDEGSIKAAARAVEADVGAATILVNNAGTMRPGSLDTMSLEEWDAILSLNLTSCLRCSRVFGQSMLDRGRGSLVHVASISATYPQCYSGAYSASKSAILALSRQLAVEWGPRGIRSNVVSPGMIRTPMSEQIYQMPGVHETRRNLVPSRRIGRPQDIADATVFLASERASYINGEELVVDGGFTRTIMGIIPRPGFENPVSSDGRV
jgi:NAD(P)-dependent dehydrogenase (short-subunit alcohol dehydrogenase family)